MKLLKPGLAASVTILLASCGSVGNLEYPEGGPPPAPVGATEPPAIEALLDPPPQAAPERLDDPLRRSEERDEDKFDLPPT